LPLNTTVPPPALTIVSLDVTESADTGIGAETAVELREMVAEVPFWVAVSVAAPPP
jgi:hypothetical protein